MSLVEGKRAQDIVLCVIGSGYIGSVLASVIASRGCRVHAVDVDRRLVDAINAGSCPIKEPGLQDLIDEQMAAGRLSFSTDFAKAAEADVILITVGTPLAPDFTPDVTYVQSAADSLAPHVRDGQVVMVKSTVPPGVTRYIVAETLRRSADVHVAFSPERLAEGAAIRELSSLPIVVGGIDAASTRAAAWFWRSIMELEVVEVSTTEAAEMVKLADNLWIDLNVALAHDLARLCDALPYPLDVLEVIAGANSLKKGQHYVNILTPSNGVGGYCLTKDPWFIHSLGKRHGIDLLIPEASRRTNDAMPAYCADRVADWLAAQGRLGPDGRVAVMGLAFKSDSGDIRFTPVQPLLERLAERGVRNVIVHDAMVAPEEAERLGVRLEPSIEATIANADCVIFTVAHADYRDLTPARLAASARPGALVYDGRRYFSRGEIDDITGLGLEYCGVGR